MILRNSCVFGKVGLVYGRFVDGDVGETIGRFKTAAEIIMATVYGTGSAFAGHKVVPMFRFNLFTADIAAKSVAYEYFLFFLWRNSLECINRVLGIDYQIIISDYSKYIG